jgi:uncharacterized lipoprotein YmbA
MPRLHGSPKGLILIRGRDLWNTDTGKNCLKRKFDAVKGRIYDVQNPALQAVVERIFRKLRCVCMQL